jgi:hypothetical protein
LFFASGRSFDLQKKAWKKNGGSRCLNPDCPAFLLLVGLFKDETRKLPLPLLLLVFRPWFPKGHLNRNPRHVSFQS